jgi:hypothetical protein
MPSEMRTLWLLKNFLNYFTLSFNWSESCNLGTIRDMSFQISNIALVSKIYITSSDLLSKQYLDISVSS